MFRHTDSRGEPITWRTCAIRLREDQVQPIYETLTANQQWRQLLPCLRKRNGMPFSELQCRIFDEMSVASSAKMLLNVWFTQVPTLWKMRCAFSNAGLHSLVEWMDTLVTSGTAACSYDESGCSSYAQSNVGGTNFSAGSSISVSTNAMAPYSNNARLRPHPRNPIAQQLDTERVKVFSMEEIEKSTNQFSERIGEGNFGGVYKASINGQTVAVKLLMGATSHFSSHRAEYQVAVGYVGRLKHENILTLLGHASRWNTETLDEEYALVYEFMPMGDLAQHLADEQKRKAMDFSVRFRIAEGTIAGLAFFNSQKNTLGKPYVHRDVKSANILLGANYHPKLGDFGCFTIAAKGTGGSSIYSQEMTSGTAAYMAPETRAVDGAVPIITAKVDTFAFGVILFELLFGRLASVDVDLRLWALDRAVPNDSSIVWGEDLEQCRLDVARFFRFLGLFCTVKEWELRPDTQDVASLLQNRDMSALLQLLNQYKQKLNNSSNN